MNPDLFAERIPACWSPRSATIYSDENPARARSWQILTDDRLREEGQAVCMAGTGSSMTYLPTTGCQVGFKFLRNSLRSSLPTAVLGSAGARTIRCGFL